MVITDNGSDLVQPRCILGPTNGVVGVRVRARRREAPRVVSVVPHQPRRLPRAVCRLAPPAQRRRCTQGGYQVRAWQYFITFLIL